MDYVVHHHRIKRILLPVILLIQEDYHMLEYSKNAPYSLQMIVTHDDSLREYNYEAEKMKMMCQENKWQEISMKNDL